MNISELTDRQFLDCYHSLQDRYAEAIEHKNKLDIKELATWLDLYHEEMTARGEQTREWLL